MSISVTSMIKTTTQRTRTEVKGLREGEDARISGFTPLPSSSLAAWASAARYKHPLQTSS